VLGERGRGFNPFGCNGLGLRDWIWRARRGAAEPQRPLKSVVQLLDTRVAELESATGRKRLPAAVFPMLRMRFNFWTQVSKSWTRLWTGSGPRAGIGPMQSLLVKLFPERGA
jgi:hypothetical protein